MTVSDRFLQQLVEHYLPAKGVRVVYSEAIKGLDGEADLKQRTIRIHPYQSQSLGCNVGGAATYNPLSSPLPPEGVAWTEEVARDEERKVKARSIAVFGRVLTNDDHIIITTLHEIGHFVIPEPPLPKYVRHSLRSARKGYEKGWFRSPSDPERPNISILLNIIDIKHGWNFREKVESHIEGLNHHVDVHKWAWKEFQRLDKRSMIISEHYSAS